MARTARNSALETRSPRLKLPIRREPYWQRIGPGQAIGYRRVKGAGRWLAKFRPESADPNAKRIHAALGPADDYLDADEVTVLSWKGAQAKAAEFFKQEARKAAGEYVAPEGGPYTVARALEDYFAHRTAEGHKSVAIDRTSANARIVPALGTVVVEKLTKSQITNWHLSLGPDMGDEGKTRSRRVTANRLLATLKAALNLAYREGKIATDSAWRQVALFQGVAAARLRFLDDDESRRFINACQGDFRDLATAALLTGCRYGELARLRVEDFTAGTIQVLVSKGGASRYVHLSSEGLDFFTQLCRRRKPGELLLTVNGHAWRKNDQRDRTKAAQKHAQIAKMSFHSLRHTYASRLVMKGAPLTVVAEQLGHASTEMVEKFYAHLAKSYVSETVRKAFGDIGIVERTTNVEPMRPRKRK